MSIDLIKDLNVGVKKFNYELENQTYISLKQLFETGELHHDVIGVYMNKKGKYGEQGVVVTPTYLINLPKHMNDSVNKIMNTEALIELVNDGKLEVEIYEYDFNKEKLHSVKWNSKREFVK